MGTSQADKDKHHDRIVAIAATRVRERGLDGIGVADLMKEASSLWFARRPDRRGGRTRAWRGDQTGCEWS